MHIHVHRVYDAHALCIIKLQLGKNGALIRLKSEYYYLTNLTNKVELYTLRNFSLYSYINIYILC